MPATSAGWTPTTADAWTLELRDALDAALGFAVNYDATIEGDWTATVGELAFTTDQGVQLAVDALDPRTAIGGALDAAVAPVVTRRPATKSRYTCDLVDDVLVPAGSLFRDADGQTWVAIAAHAIGDALSGFVVEAETAGIVTLATPLQPISPLPMPTDLTFTPGDDYTPGVAVETDSELRRRWSVSLGRPNAPTGPGMYRTIRALPWVTAASVVRTGPGTIAVYVAPEPVGADREDEIAAAIYACVGASTVTTGTDSTTTPGADGQDVTIYWTPATTQTVAIVVVTTRATGVALADIEAAVEQAIESAFDALEVGGTLYRLDVLGALSAVAGLTGCTLTINGSGSANAVPSLATNLLIAGTITIS